MELPADRRGHAGHNDLHRQDMYDVGCMTLEFLEVMEEIKSEELRVKSEEFASAQKRRKLVESYKSNTRRYDDGSIEIAPQEKGEPSQKDVKKVGRSKRYATTGKNPLTCIELKCPDDVADKAAYFHQELAKLTKDIQISEPTLPKGEYLINGDRLKVCFVKDEQKVMAYMTFEAKGLLEVRRELYNLTSEIDKCFVINQDSICPQQ